MLLSDKVTQFYKYNIYQTMFIKINKILIIFYKIVTFDV